MCVYLDQQEEVGVLTLGGRALGLLDVVSLEINTLHEDTMRHCMNDV